MDVFLEFQSSNIILFISSLNKNKIKVTVKITKCWRLVVFKKERIDFKTIDKTKDTWKVSSRDLATGDKIVVDGIGFLRIAEIAASGGLSDSHSH